MAQSDTILKAPRKTVGYADEDDPAEEVLNAGYAFYSPYQSAFQPERPWEEGVRAPMLYRGQLEPGVFGHSPKTEERLVMMDEIIDEEGYYATHFDAAIRNQMEKLRPAFFWGNMLHRGALDAILASLERLPGMEVLTTSLSEIDTNEKIIGHLREKGKEAVAVQIEEHLRAIAEDPDEPPIVTESLWSLASFVLMTPQLKTPLVGSAPGGLMELEWHLEDDGNPNGYWGRGNGVVSLRFLASGLVHYVALSGPYRNGEERLSKRGESTRRYVLRSLGEFVPRITNA